MVLLQLRVGAGTLWWRGGVSQPRVAPPEGARPVRRDSTPGEAGLGAAGSRIEYAQTPEEGPSNGVGELTRGGLWHRTFNSQQGGSNQARAGQGMGAKLRAAPTRGFHCFCREEVAPPLKGKESKKSCKQEPLPPCRHAIPMREATTSGSDAQPSRRTEQFQAHPPLNSNRAEQKPGARRPATPLRPATRGWDGYLKQWGCLQLCWRQGAPPQQPPAALSITLNRFHTSSSRRRGSSLTAWVLTDGHPAPMLTRPAAGGAGPR